MTPDAGAGGVVQDLGCCDFCSQPITREQGYVWTRCEPGYTERCMVHPMCLLPDDDPYEPFFVRLGEGRWQVVEQDTKVVVAWSGDPIAAYHVAFCRNYPHECLAPPPQPQPDGEEGQMTLAELATAQLMLFAEPMVGLYPFDQDEANRLLERWQHRLGPMHRPFHSEAFALMLDQRPIAIAVSTNTMGNRVAGYRRQEVVELGRLCAEPGNTWANRVLLRLWREVCAPRWPCWPVKACISYSHNAMHRGEIYRTDGWRLVTENAGATSGTNHGRPVADMRSAGKKRLWVWEYGS